MAKQNIWKILESVAQSQAVSAQLKEEHEREIQEIWRIVKETAQQIKQVNKQLGELGNKWGAFTEDLAWPSLEKILKKDFGVDTVSPNQSRDKNGRSFEVDVLATDSKRRDRVYVVEIKSRLTKDGVSQILDTLAELPNFYPEFSNLKVYGMLAAVDILDDAREAAGKAGIYLAQLSDDIFKLSVPKKFEPKDYGQSALRNGASKGRKKKPSSS
jgi:hypothetical protein